MANVDREKVNNFVLEVMRLAESQGINDLELIAAFSTLLVNKDTDDKETYSILSVLGNTAADIAAGTQLAYLSAKKILETPENEGVPKKIAAEISAYLAALICMFGNRPNDPGVIQQAANMFAIAHATRHHKEEAYLLSATNFAIQHAVEHVVAGDAAQDAIQKAMGK